VSERQKGAPGRSTLSLHKLGVFCGLAAAVWLGSAEAPTKLVNEGFSPFIISMGMVMGAFVARWTVPTLLKGTRLSVPGSARQTAPDCVGAAGRNAVGRGQHAHHLCGAQCWSRHRLSAVEYQQPCGLFWGWLLFKELRGSGIKGWSKVLGGAFGYRRGRGDSCRRHRASMPIRRPGCGGHHRRARRGRAARHHVYSLPQGLYQRHESALVRHHFHLRRAGHHVFLLTAVNLWRCRQSGR
jgi:hypothetical protein